MRFKKLTEKNICTALCVSGNHVYAKGKPKHEKRIEAVEYTYRFWNDCKRVAPKVCFENPI